MTGFSADWLALREPADTRARDSELTTLFARHARLRSPARFVDLACGTGANMRYLSPRVGGEQHWLLLDSDAALLEKVGTFPGCRVETRQLDLVTSLHALDLAPGVVVTASALLDLVSERWLAALVERCGVHRCAALFALSYDGRITLTPSDPDDEWIRVRVNRHQLTDKGFGSALGPEAGRRAVQLFRDVGYEVRTARSDWDLLPTEASLQRALLEGWSAAAMEVAAMEVAAMEVAAMEAAAMEGAAMELALMEADRCRSWLARRLAYVAAEAAHITVGHLDVLAVPPG